MLVSRKKPNSITYNPQTCTEVFHPYSLPKSHILEKGKLYFEISVVKPKRLKKSPYLFFNKKRKNVTFSAWASAAVALRATFLFIVHRGALALPICRCKARHFFFYFLIITPSSLGILSYLRPSCVFPRIPRISVFKSAPPSITFIYISNLLLLFVVLPRAPTSHMVLVYGFLA